MHAFNLQVFAQLEKQKLTFIGVRQQPRVIIDNNAAVICFVAVKKSENYSLQDKSALGAIEIVK